MKLKVAFMALAGLLGANFVLAQENDLHYQILRNAQRTDCRKEISIPNILGYQSLKCDFHVHTIFSDGRVTPQERIDEAWREGLDVIAITDHNTPQPKYIKADYNTSYNLAKTRADQRGVVLVKAIEYTSSKPVGHINLLFIDDANQYADQSMPAKEAIEMAAGKGAFVIYNHPGWPDMNSDLFNFQLDLLKQKKIHAMEVVNSQEFYPIVVDYCNQFQLAHLSTTDIHEPIQVNYNTDEQLRNFTIVLARDKSVESVKEALFDRRTVAVADNNLIGKEEYLFELLVKSLEVTDFKTNGSLFSCNIANISDITFLLDGPFHQQITFPAKRTVQLSGELKNTSTIFRVSNTYISAQKHLELPLYAILANKDEVNMPYLNQDVTLIAPGTRIELYCPTPGAEIHYTLDGSIPTQLSPLYTEPFALTTSAMISVRAFSQGLKPSRIFSKQAMVNTAHPAKSIRNLKNGSSYRYFEGVFTSVADFEAKGKLIDQGITASPNLAMAKASDHFGIVFSGYLFAPSDGLYTFSLESDDGSFLKVAGVNLIDNDGSHSLKKEKASIKLKKGYHSFELRYFEDYEGEALNVKWIVPESRTEATIDPRYFFTE